MTGQVPTDGRGCPACGYGGWNDPSPVDRVDAAMVAVGQVVRAVKNGPKGLVTSIGNGWTVVDYGPSSIPYKHGTDKLYVVAA